jgi:hypothetical protein
MSDSIHEQRRRKYAPGGRAKASKARLAAMARGDVKAMREWLHPLDAAEELGISKLNPLDGEERAYGHND